jgi:hypothetical protein
VVGSQKTVDTVCKLEKILQTVSTVFCDPTTYLEKILQTVSTVFCDPATYLEKILQTVSTDISTVVVTW